MAPRQPASELTNVLQGIAPGKALDLAAGEGRHSRWLAEQGWQVTSVDREQADLEKHQFVIEPNAWDLIVCWLYWQEDLMPEIAAGVRPGGIAALAGKTTGRFATSLENYRGTFKNWTELAADEAATRTYFIARKPQPHTNSGLPSRIHSAGRIC